MWCPIEIKNEPYINKYASAIDLRESSVVAKANLQRVLDMYFENNRNVEDDYLPANPEYPNLIEVDFYNLINEMFNAVVKQESADQPSEQTDSRNEEDEENYDTFMSSMYLGSGYPDINQIAHSVWSSPKVIWAFTMPFKGLSPTYAKDIAYVLFKTLDYSNFRARAFVAFFYMMGFLLLFKPTAETFVRLAWNAVF